MSRSRLVVRTKIGAKSKRLWQGNIPQSSILWLTGEYISSAVTSALPLHQLCRYISSAVTSALPLHQLCRRESGSASPVMPIRLDSACSCSDEVRDAAPAGGSVWDSAGAANSVIARSKPPGR